MATNLRKVAQMHQLHKIQDFMTPNPIVVKKTLPIQEALGIMRKKSARHLPVVDDSGHVIGLVTDRDIKLASSFIEADQMHVSDIMIEKPYCVESVVSLRNVALYMAENRYGSALILRDGQLIGIFTADDALRTLGEMLSNSKSETAA